MTGEMADIESAETVDSYWGGVWEEELEPEDDYPPDDDDEESR